MEQLFAIATRARRNARLLLVFLFLLPCALVLGADPVRSLVLSRVNCVSNFSRVFMKRPKHTVAIRRAMEDPVGLFENLLARSEKFNKTNPRIRNNFPAVDLFGEDMRILVGEIREFQNYLAVRGITKYDGLLRQLMNRADDLLARDLPYAEYGAFTEAMTTMQDLSLALRTNRGATLNNKAVAEMHEVQLGKTELDYQKSPGLKASKSLGFSQLLSPEQLESDILGYLVGRANYIQHYTQLAYRNNLPIFPLPSVSVVSPYDYSPLLVANLQHLSVPKDAHFQDKILMAPTQNNRHDRTHISGRKQEKPRALSTDEKAAAIQSMRDDVEIVRNIVADIRTEADPTLRTLLVTRMFYILHEVGNTDARSLVGASNYRSVGTGAPELEPLMRGADRERFLALPEETRRALLEEANRRIGFQARAEVRNQDFIKAMEADHRALKGAPADDAVGAATEAATRKFLAETYRDVETLSQEELARLLAGNFRRMMEGAGYLTGLRPELAHINSLEYLLKDFAAREPDGTFTNVWANNIASVVMKVDFVAYEGPELFLGAKGKDFAAHVFDVAVFERVRRLVVSGKWNVFENPETAKAYEATMRDPAFGEGSVLYKRGKTIDLFPAEGKK